jgi:hypothetical protein
MKRDFNLIRQMLLDSERNPIAIVGLEQTYNARLAVGGDLATLEDDSLFSPTDKGREFLELARPIDRWEKVQPILGTVPFGTILKMLEIWKDAEKLHG